MWVSRIIAVLWGLAVLGASGCCGGRCDVWSCATRSDNEYFDAEGRRDQRLAFRRLGEPGRPLTLLFVHGLAQTKWAWRDIGSQFDDDHQVLLLDLLGHGDSAKPIDRDGRRYWMAEQGRLLAQLIDDERRSGRVQRVVLVGLSYGGGVVLEAARQTFEAAQQAGGDADNPIAGLVLLAPGCYHWSYFDSPEFEDERVFLKGSVMFPLATAIAHDLVFEITILERSYWRQYRIPQEARREVRQQYRSIAARVAVAQATLDMATELEARRGQPRFAAVDCPVLLLQGEFDAYVDRSVMDELAEELAGNEDFEFAVLRDAGHDLPGEKASEVIEFIRGFLHTHFGRG